MGCGRQGALKCRKSIRLGVTGGGLMVEVSSHRSSGEVEDKHQSGVSLLHAPNASILPALIRRSLYELQSPNERHHVPLAAKAKG